MLRNGCGVAAESEEENIRGTEWRPADRRSGGRAKQIRVRKVKQEDVSKVGTEFRLGECGVNNKCGQILVVVQGREEVVDREVGRSVGGEENVGYVV